MGIIFGSEFNPEEDKMKKQSMSFTVDSVLKSSEELKRNIEALKKTVKLYHTIGKKRIKYESNV